MVSKRRTYTREFKVETVQLIAGNNLSVAEAARDLEIHPSTLYKWIGQYSKNPVEAFPGKGKQTSEAEKLSRLRRENQRRLHSTLGYKSPAEYEAAYFKLAA